MSRRDRSPTAPATAACWALGVAASAQNFDGLHLGLGNLHRLSEAKTRSISPENVRTSVALMISNSSARD